MELIDDGGPPMPAYPEIRHQLRLAAGDYAVKGSARASISDSRPYSFSGISNRSDVSCAATAKDS